MKFRTSISMLLLLVVSVQFNMNAQTIYPPNHSFEDDTSMQSLYPWQVSGKCFFLTSLNMNFATEGKLFIGIESVKTNSKISNAKIKIKFPVNERKRYLEFQSIFISQFETFKFEVKLEFTKFNSTYKRSFPVCSIDSMMDTICNYRSYRKKWNSHKLDLKTYYKGIEEPDSCVIEFYCDIKYFGPYDFSQVLFLDNILLTGSVDAQTSIQEQTFSNSEILVYPNPSSGFVYVDLGAMPDVVKLEVLSSDGRMLLFLDDPKGLTQLDLSTFAKGIYMLKIVSMDGSVQYKKMMLE